MKYPWWSGHALTIGVNKFGFFQTEKPYMEEIASELGLVAKGARAWVWHPLAYLVEAADHICYSIMGSGRRNRSGHVAYVVAEFEAQQDSLLAGDFTGELLRNGSEEIIKEQRDLHQKKSSQHRIKLK